MEWKDAQSEWLAAPTSWPTVTSVGRAAYRSRRPSSARRFASVVGITGPSLWRLKARAVEEVSNTMHPDEDKLKAPAESQSDRSPEETVGEDAADLPERDAMSLLDPGLLGGIFSSGSGLPMPDSAGAPTGDSAAPVDQTASDATQLANKYAPPADPSQPYEPTVSDTAQS